MYLVAESGREGRTQWPVDQATGQDRLFTGAGLTAEERTGDLARGVHAFLDVDGEREEIRSGTGLAGSGGCYQHPRLAQTDHYGSVGEAGVLTGLE